MVATAQEGTSSPYSFYGIGLNSFEGTVENQSMGGLSIYTDSIHMSLRNPAAYGPLALTTYTLGGSHSLINVKSSTEKENSTLTSLDYLALAIPAGKFGFGFGLVPYTSVGYNLASVDEAGGFATRYTGTGGINRVFLGAGYEISENFSAGLSVNYNFGNILNKNIYIREGLQFGSREMNESSLGGFNFEFALNYKAMLSEDLQLMASAQYVPESQISSDNERELSTITFASTGAEIVIDAQNFPLKDSELTLPSQKTFGAGIGSPRKWFLGAEYAHKGESNFSNRSFALKGAEYTDASKYRIGGFYIPDYSSLTNYFNRIVYRGGFRMEETGLVLDGEAINEFGISFGVGLPAGGVFSNINLGFEYGQRGTTNAGLVQEDFFKMMLSLSLNDRWFVERKFE